jgi:hypothetical protein
MDIPPAREREMLDTFHNAFVPEAVKHQGYIRVKMLKRRTVLQGTAPANHNYRFELEFESEELRQQWIAFGRPPTRVAADRAHDDDLEGLPGGALRRGLIESIHRRGADGVRTVGRLWRP